MTACFSSHQHRVLQHFGSRMRRNQNFEIFGRESDPRFQAFRFLEFFFPLSFFPLFSFCCSDLPCIGLARSPLLGACNSHNKPMQRHFNRPVYFQILFPRNRPVPVYIYCLQHTTKLKLRRHRYGQFLPWSSQCSGRKFWFEFFTQLFGHFCAYLRLRQADHSDLAIVEKIFPSCIS